MPHRLRRDDRITFATADGFPASFALSLDELAKILGTALTGEPASAIDGEVPPRRH
ncbi:MAG TPA: hypothetical protein VGL83_18330 [Stellaceae bacterium]